MVAIPSFSFHVAATCIQYACYNGTEPRRYACFSGWVGYTGLVAHLLHWPPDPLRANGTINHVRAGDRRQGFCGVGLTKRFMGCPARNKVIGTALRGRPKTRLMRWETQFRPPKGAPIEPVNILFTSSFTIWHWRVAKGLINVLGSLMAHGIYEHTPSVVVPALITSSVTPKK